MFAFLTVICSCIFSIFFSKISLAFTELELACKFFTLCFIILITFRLITLKFTSTIFRFFIQFLHRVVTLATKRHFGEFTWMFFRTKELIAINYVIVFSSEYFYNITTFSFIIFYVIIVTRFVFYP